MKGEGAIAPGNTPTLFLEKKDSTTMFIIVPVLLAILVGSLRGGHVRNLVHLSIQHAWIPVVMFFLQFSIVLFPQGQSDLFLAFRPWVLITTYALLIAFLYLNRSLPGMKVILLGGMLNLVVILANGGFMPVTSEALERSGHLDLVVVHGEHEYVLGSKDIVLSEEQTRLKLLSDVVGIPEPFPVSATLSVGDIFIMAGAAWLAYRGLTGVRSELHEPDQ
jgi:hypothetical protein